MLTSLDALVIAFIVMVGIGLLSLILMYLVRKTIVKKITFYILLLLSIISGIIGAAIGATGFLVQAVGGILIVFAAIGAFLLERKGKNFLYAQILASITVVLGIVNLFF